MATLGTFTAGSVLTAAELNAIGTFTAWTPTISGFSASSVVGSYTQINKLVIGYAIIYEPTSFTGTCTVDVPVTAAATFALAVGTRIFAFDGSSPYLIGSRATTTTTVRVTNNITSGSSINANAPFTWGAGDQLTYTFFYEAA